MKEIKLAMITVDMKKSEGYRESICAWLHEKAEEIKNAESKDYAYKARWSYYL